MLPIFWLAFIILLVFATLYLLPHLVCWFNGGVLFSVDIMFNLYLAVFNLEAALLIALLIYSLQVSSEHRASRDRRRNAKRILLTELESGLECLVRQPNAGSTAGISSLLSDLLIAYLPDIQNDLTPRQLHHLIKVTDILITTAHLATGQDRSEAADYLQGNLGFLVQESLLPAMVSPFSNAFSRISDIHAALNNETRELLNALSSKYAPLPPVDQNRILAQNGSPLVETLENGHTRIWDERGILLCDAVLDHDSTDLAGVADGWARLPRYIGEYRNGLRNGQGCSYSTLQHHKLFDGLWQDGEPRSGIFFDIVVQNIGTDTYKELFPYWNDHSLTESAITDLFSGVWDEGGVLPLDDLFVADIQQGNTGKDAFHLRPLEKFMEQNDPGRRQAVLDQLQK